MTTLSSKPAVSVAKMYQLGFGRQARKEWDKLSKPIQLQFALKLKERLKNPHVKKDAVTSHRP